MNIMDYDSFLDEMDGDLDALNMIVEELVKAINSQIPLMEELYHNRDFSRLNREAHSIKGAAENLMVDRLALAAKDLEFAAAAKDNCKVELYLSELKNEFDIFNRFIAHKL